MKLLIVGQFDGTHVGGSLARAGKALGHEVVRLDARLAYGGPAILRALSWRFRSRRPPRLRAFEAATLQACRDHQPALLLAVGLVPLTHRAITEARAMGIACVAFPTDDPFNSAQGAPWQVEALSVYDHVFTPRRANMADLFRAGCRAVSYLPFAYDEDLFGSPDLAAPDVSPDVLFVGGADADRIRFVRDFIGQEPRLTLVGGYWDRHDEFRARSLGMQSPEALRRLTAAAKVNLCLVRRANRDGHVMRSFEIPAVGGCILAENTAEHREIFGAEGDAALYFTGPSDAADKARALLADQLQRRRLALAAHGLIIGGRHTYRHRLEQMLTAAVGEGTN